MYMRAVTVLWEILPFPPHYAPVAAPLAALTGVRADSIEALSVLAAAAPWAGRGGDAGTAGSSDKEGAVLPWRLVPLPMGGADLPLSL
eukprot:1094588-Alexandrium_andersonii.AAC.1